jgi:hypothetical protein
MIEKRTVAATATEPAVVSASHPEPSLGSGGETQPQSDQPTTAPDPGAAPAFAPEAVRHARPADRGSAPLASDEMVRTFAVARLAQQLDIGTRMLTHCSHLEKLPNSARPDAVYAAARLMQANANLARALGQMAQVERRQRTIIERIQRPAAVSNDSNSILEATLFQQLTMKMLRYMTGFAGETLDPAIKEMAEDARAQENLAAAAADTAAPA